MTIRNEKLNALLNLGTARFLNVENHFITIKRFDFFYSFLRLGFNFVFQNKEETWQLLKLLSLIIKLNKPEVVKTTLNAAEFYNLIIFSVTIFHDLGKSLATPWKLRYVRSLHYSPIASDSNVSAGRTWFILVIHYNYHKFQYQPQVMQTR